MKKKKDQKSFFQRRECFILIYEMITTRMIQIIIILFSYICMENYFVGKTLYSLFILQFLVPKRV